MPQTIGKLRLPKIKPNLQNHFDCQISKITNVHKSTGSRSIIRYNDRGHNNNNKQRGRPKKNQPKEWNELCFELQKDPFLNTS